MSAVIVSWINLRQRNEYRRDINTRFVLLELAISVSHSRAVQPFALSGELNPFFGLRPAGCFALYMVYVLCVLQIENCISIRVDVAERSCLGFFPSGVGPCQYLAQTLPPNFFMFANKLVNKPTYFDVEVRYAPGTNPMTDPNRQMKKFLKMFHQLAIRDAWVV